MNRKKFIISSSLTAVSLTTFGSIIKDFNGAFTGDCDTTNDILGPFYRPDAPIRSDLTYEGLVGNRLTVQEGLGIKFFVAPEFFYGQFCVAD